MAFAERGYIEKKATATQTPRRQHVRLYSRHSFAHFVHCGDVSVGVGAGAGAGGLTGGVYFVEGRHGLVGTANLQLVPVGLVVAALFVWTLDCRGEGQHGMVGISSKRH
jgi:hypothetical protein